ncbi:TMEM175 family protein [Actinoallomurus purpureus]|uniref:TMEM175 family protein n=1 Tax=Actinoallomurus purpureus TaxID=478114 RepID=UPI0020938727|nr:TMEM175 family protein [Actinoallomurus purpureus]MCO6003538.1 TMEM175 family protein [Actinoallomurus purpureus]
MTAIESSVEKPESEHEGPVVERMMLFTDAVVAIAITLLALELPVPKGGTNAELWHAALEARPEYKAFLISFVVIWAHWSAHRKVFRGLRCLDRILSALNGLWLLMVVLIPFATKILAGDGAFQLRFGFYALIETVTSLLFLLMAWHVRRAGLAAQGTPPERFTDAMLRSGAIAACFAVSIPVAFAGDWAYLCWIATVAVTRLATRVTQRQVQP